ncbi:MAG: hypothetical protein J7619_14795 [Dyadobacter sp.]|uniref:hypothetical protein n=1 Tax=Dyadobacter sp. TaxID=1914288 RepID=UPI001B0B32E1|nr:hypothetical protein [Dyadobacter sp.]MBO9613969.1 hypothetical protein [Dyadobacter sp.]
MEQQDDKQEAHFKKLIGGISTDAPSDAFTRAVMQRVHEEATFRTLVQNNVIEAPSQAFSSGIIAQIQASSTAVSAKPVISRNVWYWLAAAWAALIVAAFFVPGNEQSALWGKLNGVIVSNQVFIQKFLVIPQPVILTIIGLSGLMLLDYFLRDKWMLLNKMARS